MVTEAVEEMVVVDLDLAVEEAVAKLEVMVTTLNQFARYVGSKITLLSLAGIEWMNLTNQIPLLHKQLITKVKLPM